MGERGFSVFELVVVLAIMALVIGLTMPSLRGYQTTSAMQAAARQFVSDLRAAQETAIDRSTQVDVVLTPASGAVTGYTVQQGATVLWKATLPAVVHANSNWPARDIGFTPLGAVSGAGSTQPFCVDNTQGLTITVGVTLATARVQLTSGTGTC